MDCLNLIEITNSSPSWWLWQSGAGKRCGGGGIKIKSNRTFLCALMPQHQLVPNIQAYQHPNS
jgi:hypothetical protein